MDQSRDLSVGELIRILSKFPAEKPVALFWDGSARGDIEGIVNDDSEVILIGEWSIYRDGKYRAYDEEKIMYESPSFIRWNNGEEI